MIMINGMTWKMLSEGEEGEKENVMVFPVRIDVHVVLFWMSDFAKGRW